MLENDIRPETLKAGQAELIARDREFLLARRSEFVATGCPACTIFGSQEFEKDGFAYCCCRECGMQYMSPRPDEKILAEFYANSLNYRYFNEFIFPASQEARRNNIFIPRVRKVIALCEQFRIQRRNLLEIGGGFGLFCEEMRKTGFFENIAAVEATKSLSETLQAKGIEVFNDLLENIEFGVRYDVVVSFEVIEHVMNPLRHLVKLHDTLAENGLLVLTFPNCDGFDMATLGRFSDSIDHEHLNYFNERAIGIILEKAGFTVEYVETPGKLDLELVRKKILSGEYFPDRFIRTLCIDRFEQMGEAFQEFLQAHRLSSHMLVAARKR